MTLDELQVGQTGIIEKINSEGIMRRRLQDMGMIIGTSVKCMIKAPSNGPTAYKVRNSTYAIRVEDAKEIEIKLLADEN